MSCGTFCASNFRLAGTIVGHPASRGRHRHGCATKTQRKRFDIVPSVVCDAGALDALSTTQKSVPGDAVKKTPPSADVSKSVDILLDVELRTVVNSVALSGRLPSMAIVAGSWKARSQSRALPARTSCTV